MQSIVTFLLSAGLMAWAPSALADGPFNVNTTYAQARSTSLKVIGDNGLTVTAEAGGQVMTDQTPLVFQFADQDDFVPVTIQGPNGASTRMKVEMRARTQTILQVTFAGDGGGRGPAGPSYIGTVQSTMGRCSEDLRADLRLEFNLNGRHVRSANVPISGAKVQVELPRGNYDVRIFRTDRGDGEYMTTSSLSVDQDGWNLTHGCEPSAASYSGVWHDPKGQSVKIVQVGVGNGNMPLYRVEWPAGGFGIGFVLPDGSLALTGSKGTSMAFLYQPQNGGLAANWFVTGQFSDNPNTQINMASENANGPSQFGGNYAINGRSVTGNNYDGTLAINPRGPLYGLHWGLSNGAQLDGAGLAQGGALAAVQGPPGSFIAILSFSGVNLACKFAVIGAPAVATETLSR